MFWCHKIIMPEKKHVRFLITLRPQCGLLEAEADAARDWISRTNHTYYCATEDAHLGHQATHVHILLKYNSCGRRKSNLVAEIWRKIFPKRIKESFRGFDVRHVPDTSWMFHLGYLQKENHTLNSYNGISDEDLRVSFCHYLELSKKALKGKHIGCIPLKKSNYMAFIRDERIRTLCPSPVRNFTRMLQTDHYTIPFASMKQQLILERCLAAGQNIPRVLVQHILSDCTQKCDNCDLHTELPPCTCFDNSGPCEHVQCKHLLR